MSITYTADIAQDLITESAKEFGDTYEPHLAAVVLSIATADWNGSWRGGAGIDLEALIWDLNERHDRKDDYVMGSSEAEREAFTAVMRQLYTLELAQD